jgi:hypothetical protein
MILKIEVDMDSFDVKWRFVSEAVKREVEQDILREARQETKAEIQRQVRAELSQYKESVIKKAVKDACAAVIRPREQQEKI